MSRSTLTVGDAIKNQGSLHVRSDDVEIPDARVQDIVRDAILHSPTPFNCQSGRAVVLLKEEHNKFWDMAHEAAKASVAPPVFEKTFAPRIKMFRAAYGTILFYESARALKATEEKYPIVKDKIPQWSEHASGMLQCAVWTMLTAEGLGVNLQHYNPMVDSGAAKQWNIPAEWSLKAQMVFGKPAGPRIVEKEFEPVEDKVMVFGA
ncbi:nitroreductase [Lepidopterella palustris CBS 459.81]|uniref:Nitroreductase n=1 Tax=Lepidopterella palustris CBS 459.81 TaxID=1314670 RepID=A0A8E2E6M7_9PEZI|nr:nitroreductase [Lepidopterella palustris CBS 459.81]